MKILNTYTIALTTTLMSCTSSAQPQLQETSRESLVVSAMSETVNQKQETIKEIKKMKVEIWSDVMCPFCYIGKRKFEAALSQFENKDNIEVVWKSFQLNPNMETNPNKSNLDYLMEIKGWSRAQAEQTTLYVTNMAKEVGLEYHLDKAVTANSFDAHRFVQYAKKHGKGDAAEERLFKAYFTEAKNTADHNVLVQLATDIGLDGNEVKKILAGQDYSNEVKSDLYEAQQLGISGVPFFVIDRKYAVSGAQPSETFLGALNKAWSETEKFQSLNSPNGAVCTPEGECK